MSNDFYKSIKPHELFSAPKKFNERDVRNLVQCSTREARQLISYALASKYQVLPIALMNVPKGKVLTLAVSESTNDHEIKSLIRYLSGMEAKIIKLNPEIVAEAVFYAYKGSQETFLEKVESLKKRDKKEEKPEQGDPLNFVLQGEVPQFFESLVNYAFSNLASDIHILPKENGTFVFLRIHGNLLTHCNPICSLKQHSEIVSRIKVLARLDLNQRKMPQDGAISFNLKDKKIDLRVSIIPTVNGEKVVIRIHNSLSLKDVEELCFDYKTLSMIEDGAQLKNGIIVFCGATGSGKSTSIYALMKKISNRNLCIVSIEDPVELRLPFMDQISVNEKIGLSYSTLIKSVLRQDPDVIMVGEIRDRSSAQAAYEAAMTGHLVVTSFHSGSIKDFYLRLKEMGVSEEVFSQTTKLVVVQKLEARLCDNCKVVDLESSNQTGERVYKAVGCSKCEQSGFQDRVPVTEALCFDGQIRGEHITLLGMQKSELTSCNYTGFEDSRSDLRKRGFLPVYVK